MIAGVGRQDVIVAERCVLQALCQGTAEGSVREAARRFLSAYPWREPVHKVVFEIVMSMPVDVPELIREQLPARLTRRGFPDVAGDDFFRPHSLRKEDLETLMRRMSS